MGTNIVILFDELIFEIVLRFSFRYKIILIQLNLRLILIGHNSASMITFLPVIF